MRELKPCPFCGLNSGLNVLSDDDCWWYVSCSVCGATGGYGATKAKAIAAWNKRAGRTCENTVHLADERRFHCSVCEFGCWVRDVADGRDKIPGYCPCCGAKVVEG